MKLKEHNQISLKNTLELFESNDRVCIEQATGTGKSYVISALVATGVFRRVLILAPSTYIIGQFKEKFPRLHEYVDVLDYMTYSKLTYAKEEDMLKWNYDLIVVDEYHRLGANGWGSGFNKLLNLLPSAKVFGATATPIRYFDKGRNMSKEIFNSIIANVVTLDNALSNKIIATPKYVLGMYDIKLDIEKIKRKLDKDLVENKEEINSNVRYLVNNFDKTYGVPKILKKYLTNENKFIVFCENVEHLNQAMASASVWFEAATNKDVVIYKMYCGNSCNSIELEQFKNGSLDKIHLMFVVNILNEGLHIDGIDGVIMLRSTLSLNIYYQQLGRCLTSTQNKKPLVLDLVSNSKNIARSELYIDDVKRKQKKRSVNNKEYTRKDYDVLGFFEVYDESAELVKLINQINESISDWESMFVKLAKFKEENGHSYVPQSMPALRRWRHRQVQFKREGRLRQSRVDKLDSIGFEWACLDYQWMNNFEQLIAYKKIYGHPNVPKNTSLEYEYKSLGDWLYYQRKRWREGSLEKDRQDLLLSIGVSLDSNRQAREDERWNAKYILLVQYVQEYGTCIIKNNIDEKYKVLKGWMQHQRKYYKGGKIPTDRYNKLVELGVVFTEK